MSISLEIERTKEELLQNHPSPKELLISEYLDSAIKDIQISRHLEEITTRPNEVDANSQDNIDETNNQTEGDKEDSIIVNPT